MRTRQSLEMMSIWEEENNPNFNSVEFDRIKSESGKNTFSMNFASEDELHLLSNLETHNAKMIEAGMAQYEREVVLMSLFEKQLSILNKRSKKNEITVLFFYFLNLNHSEIYVSNKNHHFRPRRCPH
jgi:hypothetical protein